MLFLKQTVLATALLGTTVVAAATSGPASAEKNQPYRLEQVCGASYHFVNELPLVLDGTRQIGLTILGYSAVTKKNCAVTFKIAKIGTPTYTTVSLRKAGGPLRTDKGKFAYYAGPVYVTAPGKCVQFGGSVRVKAGVARDLTPFGNCG
ncbi:MAG: hypothetical protein WKF94_17250 [Solirubrobacteraceae bacterium]